MIMNYEGILEVKDVYKRQVCNGDRDFWKLRCNPLRGNNLKKGEM